MADNTTKTQSEERLPVPNADLKALDPLVGTWKLSGDTTGTITYEWMKGGFFLVQRVNMTLYGHEVNAIEIIGHLHPFGEPPSTDIRSRAYDSAGNTLDYVYEVNGDTLTIWGGERGSPSYYRGQFSRDGSTNAGEWVYPDGGYKSTMTRVKDAGRRPRGG
jgi:hypothetical protein